MLSDLSSVWSILGIIIGAIPADVTTAVAFVFCSIGIIGILRSL